MASAASVLLGLALVPLLWPYWQVRKLYGFQRPWIYVATMLPKWKSYLLADRSRLWGPISDLVPGFSMRHEHQLFPGLAAVILVGIAVAWLIPRRHGNSQPVVRLHLWAGLTLVAITFLFHGFTLYRMIWALPGFDSIRAVTRIILVLMWPLAVAIAFGTDRLVAQDGQPRLFRIAVAACLSGLLVAESVLVYHGTYNKAETQARIARLREQIPTLPPKQPVLILANQPGDPWQATEIDAMLLGQDLAWPVLNGYSGNFAPGFGPTLGCGEIPDRIIHFMHFAQISSAAYYLDLIDRTVPIGFDDCDPSWWTQRPALSSGSGSLAVEQVAGLHLRVLWIKTSTDRTRAQIEITNNSSERIPIGSTSGTPFELTWRFSRKPGLILHEGQRPVSIAVRYTAALNGAHDSFCRAPDSTWHVLA